MLPHLRTQRSGAIINLSSIGGLVSSPGGGFYNASKFAVEGLSGALFGELQPLGIHVMVVEPGPFRTDFLGRSGVLASKQIEDYRESAGKLRDYYTTQGGKQKGDPVRAARAMIAAVNADDPPRHLLLGENALTRFRKHLDEFSEELKRWESTSLGADFPEEAEPPPSADGNGSQPAAGSQQQAPAGDEKKEAPRA